MSAATATLNTRDLAVELRIGPTRAKELLKSGEIPSVLVGGTLRRVRRKDFDAYLDGLEPSLPGERE